MTRLQLLVKVIEAPLRFFLVNVMFILSYDLSALMISRQDGYPWPGFISYSLPNIVFLFLGVLLAVAFVYLGVLAPIRGWGRLFSFLLAGAACSGLTMAVTPGNGLISFVCLLLVGFYSLSAFSGIERRVFLVRMVSILFVLLLLKFVVMPQGTLRFIGRLILGQKLLSVSFPAGTAPAAKNSEILVFLSILLFAGALSLQWPRDEQDHSAPWLFGPLVVSVGTPGDGPCVIEAAPSPEIAQQGRPAALPGPAALELPGAEPGTGGPARKEEKGEDEATRGREETETATT